MSSFMDHIQHTYDEAQAPSVTKHLNVYETGREYGGPEEGGWYYDTGRFVDTEVFTGTSEQLYAHVEEMQNSLDARANTVGVPEVHSVMYRGGRHVVRVENKPGADFPAERPFYS